MGTTEATARPVSLAAAADTTTLTATAPAKPSDARATSASTAVPAAASASEATGGAASTSASTISAETPAPPIPATPALTPLGRIQPKAAAAGRAALTRARAFGQRVFNAVLVCAALLIAIALGVQSSRALIKHGVQISTVSYGPWTTWVRAGRPDADPYSRAHVLQGSLLRLSSDTAGVFEANSDAQSAYLHSSCDYVLEGPYAKGAWWSIAVFDATGHIISNDAQRYAFTSDTVAANPDGSYIITLGRDARPGNWLPTGGAGRLVIVFTLLDPASGLSSEQRAQRYLLLPEIRRENCS